jgi:hypothetical protein
MPSILFCQLLRLKSFYLEAIYLNADAMMQELNIEQFQDKFDAFQLEYKNLGPMTRNTLELLRKINKSVNSLIEEIDVELN